MTRYLWHALFITQGINSWAKVPSLELVRHYLCRFSNWIPAGWWLWPVLLQAIERSSLWRLQHCARPPLCVFPGTPLWFTLTLLVFLPSLFSFKGCVQSSMWNNCFLLWSRIFFFLCWCLAKAGVAFNKPFHTVIFFNIRRSFAWYLSEISPPPSLINAAYLLKWMHVN